MNWLARQMRENQRAEEAAFLRPHKKPVWRVPADSPCTNCVQNPGDSICKSRCDYWGELQKLKAEGLLSRVNGGDKV